MAPLIALFEQTNPAWLISMRTRVSELSFRWGLDLTLELIQRAINPSGDAA